jgi:hypothetical protein
VQESKIQLIERWRREGRTEEVTHYRDEVREQLRAQGKTRKEAREASWQAARAAFPPLPAAEDQLEFQPVVQATEPAAQGEDRETTERGFSSVEKDWVRQWFNCLPSLAKWQRDYGVTLSDDGLRELLKLLGFGSAWAFMLGARGDRPPGSAGRRFAHVAALIDLTFQELAEAIDANWLQELVEAADASGAHDLQPAGHVQTPSPGQ